MQKFKSCKISIANVSFSSLVYLNIVLYMLTISFLQKNIVKLGKDKPNIEFILVGLSWAKTVKKPKCHFFQDIKKSPHGSLQKVFMQASMRGFFDILKKSKTLVFFYGPLFLMTKCKFSKQKTKNDHNLSLEAVFFPFSPLYQVINIIKINFEH